MSTWVLIRGLAREHGHWGDFVPAMKAAFPDATVLTPDLPGNGERHTEPSPLTVAAMAEALHTGLAQEGHAPPYRVVSLSLGAMVAVAWAQTHPEVIERMVLINTSMRPFNPFYERLRPAAWPTFLSAARPGRSRTEAERAILELTSNLPAAREAALPEWSNIAQARPVSGPNLLRQLLAAAQFRAPTAPPPMPLLLLASTQDRLASVRCSRTLADQWQCPCIEHPTAGHDLPLDDGPWVIAQLQRWMRALGEQ